LTRIYQQLTKQLLNQFPNETPFGMTVTPTALAELSAELNDNLLDKVSYLTGMNKDGVKNISNVHEQLVAQGKVLGDHLNEPLIVNLNLVCMQSSEHQDV
jgi:hypothetical protein